MIASVKVCKAAKQAEIANTYGTAVNPQCDFGHYPGFPLSEGSENRPVP
jgi:hypothetical protein